MNTSTKVNLNRFLNDHDQGELRSLRPVSGGSINEAYRMETSSGTFFLKANSANRFANMFETEAVGLIRLAASPFTVPEPIATAVVGDEQFLLMEWVETGSPNAGFWETFGNSLAQLHRISDLHFGLDHENYIGSLRQHNTKKQTWAEFYREERLLPQIKLAEQNGQLTSSMKIGFDALFAQMETIFPVEEPSLLHGDLWSGNMMVAANGSPSIFDPAVYFGHREMDLAMMALFGGFGSEWVSAYNEVYPLEAGWQERIPLGQLYPLMVHVNLFGGGYGSDVEHILNRFR